MSALHKILGAGAYFSINKELIKKLGLHGAVLIGMMLDRQDYCYRYNKEDNLVHKDRFFDCPQKTLCENSGLSPHYIRTTSKELEKMGLISIERRGIPAKQFAYIFEDKIIEVIQRKESQVEEEKTVEGAYISDVNPVNNSTSISLTTGSESHSQQGVNSINNIYIDDNISKTVVEQKAAAKDEVKSEQVKINEIIIELFSSEEYKKSIQIIGQEKGYSKDELNEQIIKAITKYIRDNITCPAEKYVVGWVNRMSKKTTKSEDKTKKLLDEKPYYREHDTAISYFVECYQKRKSGVIPENVDTFPPMNCLSFWGIDEDELERSRVEAYNSVYQTI